MTTATSTPTVIRVTAADIRHGEPGRCHRCAVSLALQRATGDTDARVMTIDYVLHLCVHGKWIEAPKEVRRFVNDYDNAFRFRKRAVLPRKLSGTDFAPFSFELPPAGDQVWLEECCGCQELRLPADLNSEGRCPDCQEKHR